MIVLILRNANISSHDMEILMTIQYKTQTIYSETIYFFFVITIYPLYKKRKKTYMLSIEEPLHVSSHS